MAEKLTLARPYVQAVFVQAKADKALDAWSRRLTRAAELILHPEVRDAMTSPRVTRQQAADLFIDLLGDLLDEAGRNFIRLLVENDRVELLPEIAELFAIRRAEAEGTIEAEVATAFELSADQQARLREALGKRLERKVTLTCRVDPQLLGGAVVRAGDLVIDGSALGRLNRLANELTG